MKARTSKGSRTPEAELRQINAFLDAIVENIPDMVFVKDARTLRYERFNRAGELLLDRSREELLGKTDRDCYPKDQAKAFRKGDLEALQTGKLVDIPEEPILTRNGIRWLRTKKVPVLGDQGEPRYLLGISEDITARKNATERARALQRELAALVTNARDAIISWDLNGLIVSWNPAAEAVYGKPAEHAIGTPVESLVPVAFRTSFRAAQKKVQNGMQLAPMVVRRLREDCEIEVEESLFLIRDESGRPLRLASMARDLTELARLKHAAEVLAGSDHVPPGSGGELTHSSRMREVLKIADAVAEDDRATVVLLGETGVGKGWLAHRIHAKSARGKGPFLEVNCASLGPQLIESELFGHERGAFTGAVQQKRGLVEAAAGGTLFLDEVGELPLEVQARLLTFMDRQTFRRVGGTCPLKADARILAATNQNLMRAVTAGRFREDLYYRLSVFPIEVPPLRERREDIPALAGRLLEGLQRRDGQKIQSLPNDVVTLLQRHGWPGNVRELRNVLERALILSRNRSIGIEHLPVDMRTHASEVSGSPISLCEAERLHIGRVLDSVDGNRSRAAKLLGISRSTLKRKMTLWRRKDSGFTSHRPSAASPKSRKLRST